MAVGNVARRDKVLKRRIILSEKIQAVRGMNDILPEQIPYWQYLESCLREAAQQYGYSEIRLPLVEQTQLFERTVGKATDIVEKEMYTFLDRQKHSLTLRPEGTAGCARSIIENHLTYDRPQRLWYMGPMFRHERPQKGRHRQFHHFGIEALGMTGPDVELEQMLMLKRIFKALELDDHLELQINSLGSLDARQHYRTTLVNYLKQHQDKLDEDSLRRLETNPLRILDSKNPDMQAFINQAPQLLDYLDEPARAHFTQFCAFLDHFGIPYQINPRLVRGLDYYGLTVYEWVSNQLGAQGTVCAGGRYDGLIEQLGGKPTPAVGFAMGLERIVSLLESLHSLKKPLDIYFVLLGEAAFIKGMKLAEILRTEIPQITIMTHCGSGGIKQQMKQADKMQATYALILGESELMDGTIQLKYLREEKPQRTIIAQQIAEEIKRLTP